MTLTRRDMIKAHAAGMAATAAGIRSRGTQAAATQMSSAAPDREPCIAGGNCRRSQVVTASPCRTTRVDAPATRGGGGRYCGRTILL